MDEQIMRGRVYGADHDDPEAGRRHGRAYVDLVGGPLDGLFLDVTGWTAEQLRDGVALATELARHGPGGRALYRPRTGDPRRFDWEGDSP
ncbi:hypothetical protein ACF08N_16260 [Streptomyces sp. NPDC015127]|uniref:hypothetical protein n=1 Tax=Streptomyces sp. NPDC015127 TaxID=3364939 RepID=UPI0036F58547